MYEAPVASSVPAVGALYQVNVPDEAVAASVKEAVPHAEAGVVEVTEGMELMVAVTAVLGDELHAPLFVST